MKVLIIRLVTVSLLAFFTVFCAVYAMGTLSSPRVGKETDSLTGNSEEALLVTAKENHNAQVTHVSGSDEPRQASTPPQRTSSPSTRRPEKSWFQGTQVERSRFEHLLRSRRAPALQVRQWTNTKPLRPAAREGHIVVLCFWSTWCQPCLNSIDFNNQLHQHYKDQKVMLIGICNADGSQDMAEIVKTRAIKYPVAIDDPGNKSVGAYEVQSIPTYFVIDREGRLRFADIKRSRLDDAIEYLLNRD